MFVVGILANTGEIFYTTVFVYHYRFSSDFLKCYIDEPGQL